MFATANDSIVRTVAGTIGTVVFASACLLAAAGPAAASEAPRASVVSYSDLDLAHAPGRNALEFRIKAAARNVCASGLDDVRGRTAEARCVRDAVNSAKRNVAAIVPAYQG
jgi:UrcA family protein